MTTNTDLANSALALLGEMPIALITDTSSKPARICNQFADSCRTEVNRMTFQTESLALASMDVLAQEATAVRLAARVALPLLGSQEIQSKMEQLFSMRLQEAKVRALHSSALNGKILAMITNDLAKTDLSTSMLTEFSTTFQADATKEVLRLTHAASEATAYGSITDSLILEAIDTRQAAKIAAAMTLPSTVALEELAAKRLQEAKVRGLHSSALNGKILAMIGNDLAKIDLSTAMLTEFSTTYQAAATKDVLRLTHAVSEATAYGSITDPLVLDAIDARQAAKIASALTLPSAPMLEDLAARRLQEAKVRLLHSSALNGRILGMIGNDLEKIDLSPSMLTEFSTTFQADATKEVLRLTHATSEATAYGSITDSLILEAIDTRQAAKIAAAMALPSTQVLEELAAKRLQEAKVRGLHSSALNGRILGMIGNDLAKIDLSTSMLTEFVTTYQADATKEVLRLTFATSEATAYGSITDSLILEAIDSRHAARIASALTLPSTQALEELAARRLQEAKVRGLHSSALNGKILAMIGNDLSKIDLSPAMLTEFSTTFQADATKEVLRLTFATSEATAYGSLTDPLILEAIDTRQAAKIASAMTLPSTAALEELAARRLQEAKVRALHSSALNGKILAMIVNDLAKIDLSPSMLTEFSTTYADESLREVLRMSRWGCAIKRETLSAATAPTVGNFTYKFNLPATCLRVLEVNGEEAQESDESYEIEGAFLLSNTTPTWIRYIDKITLAACDPSLALAINTRHAAKIAAALALPSLPALESLFQKRLAEARQQDAQEAGSAEKTPWARVFGRSRLLRAHGTQRNPLRIEDY